MAFKTIHLRLNGESKTHIKLGYRTASITVEMPVKRLAKQLVRAAYGSKARIVGGRHE